MEARPLSTDPPPISAVRSARGGRGRFRTVRDETQSRNQTGLGQRVQRLTLCVVDLEWTGTDRQQHTHDTVVACGGVPHGAHITIDQHVAPLSESPAGTVREGYDRIVQVTDPAALVTEAGSGLDRVGWTTADPFPDVRAALEQRIADGCSGRLGFTFSDPRRATTPDESWPWAKSIVVGLSAYLPQAGTPHGRARIARFAEEDHYIRLRTGMERVAAALGRAGFRAEVVIDDSRLVDRAAAHRAGVAWWGKNTMLLTPGLGPWFLIGCVVTDAEFEASQPMQRDCGTCEACLPACPTGALVAPGILDARRCLAAILQAPGPIPEEYRTAVGGRIYGCDDCIEACPPGSRLLDWAVDDRGSVDVVELLRLGDVELLRRYGHFYLPGGSPRSLRRNALVVLGNIGGEEHLTLLAGYLMHPDSLLRDHARWAVGAIGGPLADRILELDQPLPIGK